MINSPSAATTLADDLDATPIDDQGQAITLHAYAAIGHELQQLYRQLEALDLDFQLDAVILATPPFQRPDQFELAGVSGKHIYMEKPLAVDAAGCRRMLAASAKSDPRKRISVGFQQRYGKDYRTAYEQYRTLLSFRTDRFFLVNSAKLIEHKMNLSKRFVDQFEPEETR